MKTLFVEIGTEEIPARFIVPAKEGLEKLFTEGLAAKRISSGSITINGTPRRMAIVVNEVSEKQEERVTLKFGPPANRAYDEKGSPTKSALGFAKSQGVTVDELTRAVKDGIEFIAVEKTEKGDPTEEVLPGMLAEIISKIPYQKRMRWGSEDFEFARPIQWLVVLFGGKPVTVRVADVESGDVTYAHRFLANGPVRVNDPARYYDIMRDNYIVVKEDERLRMIREGIKVIEEKVGGKAIRDEELISEILYITEYPYPLLGSFEREYLAIPKEVLVNVMKSHQRYIPVEGADGQLMPYFICFANTVPRDESIVVRGNEKVLRARLADAKFFFEEDKKLKLSDLYDRLSSIVFHVKLGTLKEKAERVRAVARWLASVLQFPAAEKIDHAARIAKADLMTHMVGEFPELQGTMGRIYASIGGEDSDVAQAIEEHYLPTGSNSHLPATTLGAIMGIADKIDSIVSFFSVGITPTGNLDPYALRRQALGIIRIATEKRLHVPLAGLIECSYESGLSIAGRGRLDDTKEAILEFIGTRFKFAMIEEGHNQEFVEAVLPYVALDVFDGVMRLDALEGQKSLEDFSRLMVGFRRVFNITKQLTGAMAVDPVLFCLKEEEALYNLYKAKKDTFFSLMGEGSYERALGILVEFKEAIDSFFDKVFVMDKDESIKNNRLALLKYIKDMFLTLGDFSKIRIE